MPKRATTPRPTDAELEILNVLWQRGACTVRDVHQAITRTRPAMGYTTVLKLMQIMAEKNLVRRDESQRAHVYEAQLEREQTQRQLIGELIERAFEGSATKLVMQALSAKQASAEELSTIREMLDEFERGDK
jgi:predicted transcriptional regulator